MALHTMFVKNTFVHVIDEEQVEGIDELPKLRLGRRMKTLPVVLTHESEDECNVVRGRSEPTFSARVKDMAFDEVQVPRLLLRIEQACAKDVLAIAQHFRGHVMDASESPTAHEVLLALVRCLGSKDVAFMAAELRGHAFRLALSPEGSEVICALVGYAAQEESTQNLIHELLLEEHLKELVCHKSGCTVVNAVLSSGTLEQQAVVIRFLGASLQRFARHRFGHSVVAQALLQSCFDNAKALAEELMSTPGTVVNLACHNYGVEVVRALLQVPLASDQVLFYVLKGARRVMKDKFGSHLLHELFFFVHGRSGWRSASC